MNDVSLDTPQLVRERARLVRLCYRLTGALDAAEDLAQETLIEALRNAHKLHDPSGLPQWLSRIAYHVCLRFNSRQGHDLAQLASPSDDWDAPDDYDLEIELDRHELATLLDRALALLPAESRDALIARYVQVSPIAAIAERLDVSAGVVAKRLERGRLRLKRVLGTHLIHEAASFGLAERLYADWETTPLWCPVCGRRQLLGSFAPNRELWLICKPCLDMPVSLYGHGGSPELLRGVTGYRASFLRLLDQHWQRYASGVAHADARCHTCGGRATFAVDCDPLDGGFYAQRTCAQCGTHGWQFKLDWHLLASPEGRQFWADHPRLQREPNRVIETGGVPAMVASYRSVTGGGRIDGVFVRDTFAPIAIYFTPGG